MRTTTAWRDEGEKGIAGVQIRITKWYLDPADHSGGTDGTWKRAYLINEKGEQVLEPVTTCVTSDGKPVYDSDGVTVVQDLPLGHYKSEDVPTRFSKPDEESDTTYLCGYTVEVASVPAGYTLTRPHLAESSESYGVESDLFRNANGTGISNAQFALVNRTVDVSDDGARPTRADGMVIIAREKHSTSTNTKTLQTYKGTTYDTDMNETSVAVATAVWWTCPPLPLPASCGTTPTRSSPTR